MYIREIRLGQTYKALNECHKILAGQQLSKLINLSKRQIANNPDDARFLFQLFLETYKPIQVDSLLEKYALPLVRRIQTLPSSDPYTQAFAVYEESLLWTRLNRKGEAMKALESYHAKVPSEPIILFELDRMNILANETKAGLAFLMKAKQNLNGLVTKEAFMEVLKGADFDKVRHTSKFKKLLE